MEELISEYIKQINLLYKSGHATELSYRAPLQHLIEKCTGFNVINEQARMEYGTPDLALRKKDLLIAFIETKDIKDSDLDGQKKNKAQFDKYKAAVDTIVFTDYLDFHLYKEGDLLMQVELATIVNDQIVLNESALDAFKTLMDKLRYSAPQKISSPGKLAELMADKAKLIAAAVLKELNDDKEEKGKLWGQLKTFRNLINKGLKEEEFADLFAQTVAYGLFVARIHDNTKSTFTRNKAAENIPHTNPLLRDIFQQLAGYDINNSILLIVDDLVSIFAATDVEKLRRNISKEMEKRDPMIHFYEEFLSHYNPAAKKKYGVYYTPPAVVEFIVRAVDDILKSEFGIEEGLADISKVNTPIKKPVAGKDIAVVENQLRHRVQILDPATGTGTFLAEVVSLIKERLRQPGIWPKYVDEHLLPRIYGFEYMMAPYTIAHLKIDMLLDWLDGEKISEGHQERLKIYLTNSLTQTDLLDRKHSFATTVAEEVNEANEIKHNAPVMIVMGNPPYSGESTNTSEWIMGLMEDYKKEPNSNKRLNEKNPKWINNDYCKFIRMAQDYVDRKGEGIVAYICANSFLDNPTFRGMRWHLLKSFDKIYIINLHGDSNKKEKCPDGSKDVNVFDIMTGTSINIFVKKEGKKENELADVYYAEKYGLRKEKFNFLLSNKFTDIKFERIKYRAPYYLLTPQDTSGREEYERGFQICDLCKIYSAGIVTSNDDVLIDYEKKDLYKKIKDAYSSCNDSLIKSIAYKPFDNRFVYYDVKKIERARLNVMRHLIDKKNLCMVVAKQCVSDWKYVLITDCITNLNITATAGRLGSGFVFPLYLYPSESELGFDVECKPNLDDTIRRTIENWVKYGQAYKPLTANEQSGELGFDAAPEEPHFIEPEDIFDYIYGVLHSPHYREKYKEFLKVDFPRIPYPKNAEEFEHYKECGHQLRELHLMRNVPKSKVILSAGSGKVEKMKWEEGRVYINESQYFEHVPEEAWTMYIGGYQPAQKWLKDRKDRTLNTEEIEHYEKIIRVLLETKRIMDSIDDPNAQVAELKHKVQELEHQLQAKNNSDIHYHINANNVNLQTDGTINIGEINEK